MKLKATACWRNDINVSRMKIFFLDELVQKREEIQELKGGKVAMNRFRDLMYGEFDGSSPYIKDKEECLQGQYVERLLDEYRAPDINEIKQCIVRQKMVFQSDPNQAGRTESKLLPEIRSTFANSFLDLGSDATQNYYILRIPQGNQEQNDKTKLQSLRSYNLKLFGSIQERNSSKQSNFSDLGSSSDGEESKSFRSAMDRLDYITNERKLLSQRKLNLLSRKKQNRFQISNIPALAFLSKRTYTLDEDLLGGALNPNSKKHPLKKESQKTMVANTFRQHIQQPCSATLRGWTDKKKHLKKQQNDFFFELERLKKELQKPKLSEDEILYRRRYKALTFLQKLGARKETFDEAGIREQEELENAGSNDNLQVWNDSLEKKQVEIVIRKVTAELSDPNFDGIDLKQEEKKSISTLSDQSFREDDDDDDDDENEKSIKIEEGNPREELRDNISKYFVSQTSAIPKDTKLSLQIKDQPCNVFDFSPRTFAQFSNYQPPENYEENKKSSLSSFVEVQSIFYSQIKSKTLFDEEPGNAQLGKQLSFSNYQRKLSRLTTMRPHHCQIKGDKEALKQIASNLKELAGTMDYKLNIPKFSFSQKHSMKLSRKATNSPPGNVQKGLTQGEVIDTKAMNNFQIKLQKMTSKMAGKKQKSSSTILNQHVRENVLEGRS